MYIGKLAEITGVSPKAIRYYENLGLLPKPERLGKYRTYTKIHVEYVTLIKHAQKLGFKLAEIENLLARHDVITAFPWDLAIQLVEQKRQQIQLHIQELLRQDLDLVNTLEQLRTSPCHGIASCN